MSYVYLVAERTEAESEDPDEDLEAEQIMEQFDDLDEEVIQFEKFKIITLVQLRMAVEKIGMTEDEMENRIIDFDILSDILTV